MEKKIRTYVVKDNSYQQCLDDNGLNHYLAGFSDEIPKKVKVIIQPFNMFVKTISGYELRTMIIGICPDGLRHLILFY